MVKELSAALSPTSNPNYQQTPIDVSAGPQSMFPATPVSNAPSVISTKAVREEVKKNQEELAGFVESPEVKQDTLATKTIGSGEKEKPVLATKTTDDVEEGTDRTADLLDNIQTQVNTINSQIDSELDIATNLLDTRIAQIDADTQYMITSIQRTFNQRRERMIEINKNALAAQTTLGIRAGRQRYAPEIQTSILKGEEMAGIQRIAALDAEEASLIAEAKRASNEDNFKLLSEKMDAMRTAREDKRQALLDLQDMIMKNESLEMEKLKEAREEERFELEKDRFAREEAEARTEEIMRGIENLIISETPLEEISAETLKEYEEAANLPEGSFSKYYANLLKSKKREESLADLEVKLKKAQIAKVYSDIEADKYKGGITLPTNVDPTVENQSVIDAFNFALGSIPATRQGQYVNTMNNYLQSGNMELAKDYLLKTARDGMTAAPRNQVVKRETMLNIMNDISENLDTLEREGIDTGFLRGTAEDIANKIGKTTDPRIKEIQTAIAKQLTDFTVAVSGVQFSNEEREMYEKMFPSIGQVAEVNKANIAALTNSIVAEQEQYYKSQIGELTYDAIFSGRYQKTGLFEETTPVQQTSGVEVDYLDNYLSNIPQPEIKEEVKATQTKWSGMEGVKSFFGGVSGSFEDTLKGLNLIK